MKTVKFTREEFHQLTWAESLPTLSKKYDATYQDLRKIVIEMGIPLPKVGYWQNKSLGKQVVVEPLPVPFTGKQEIELRLLEDGDVHTPKLKVRKGVLVNDIEKINEPVIVVPSKLSNPDKLVVAAKNALEKQSSVYGRYPGLVGCSFNLLDIMVSPGNVGRALRFMDALIKALRIRGGDVVVGIQDTYAVVNGEQIKIRLRERFKKPMVEDDKGRRRSEYNPTGILYFKTDQYAHREVEFKDGKELLEDQLSDIVRHLEAKAKERQEEELRWQQNKRERDEKERLLREQQQLREKEKTDFKHLLNVAQQWHQTSILRNYLNEIEAKAIANNAVSDDLKTWLAWARQKADAYDPMKDLDKQVNEIIPYVES